MISNAEQRRRVVADFQRSGLSRREYCEQQGLSVNTLDNWRRKVKAAAPGLVRVELAQGSPACGRSRLILVLANGRRIEAEGGFDEQELSRLIRVAEGGVNQ